MGQIPTLPPLTNAPFTNQGGYLTPVALNILQQLWTAAFDKGLLLLGFADNINFNLTGDTVINLSLPQGAIGWHPNLGLVWGLQGSFSTCKAGIYSAPYQQGTTLSGQVGISGITSPGYNVSNATSSVTPSTSAVWNFTTIYFNVGTAQGGASLGNFYLYGYPVF